MIDRIGAIGESVPRGPRTQLAAEVLLVCLALLLHWLLAVSSVLEKSVTSDEVAHLTSGYAALTLGDFRLNTEGGTLSQQWAALPLLLDDPQLPGPEHAGWVRSNVWSLGEAFLFTMGNPTDQMLWRARAMIALLSVMLGLLVYLWTRSLFGVAGAAVALVLYVASPSMLAHGALVTADLPTVLFFMLAMWMLWLVLHRVTWPRLIFCALAVLGLVLTKMSAVLLIPMAALLAIVRLINREMLPVRLLPKHLTPAVNWKEKLGWISAAAAFVLFVVISGVWANFRFRFAPDDAGAPPFEEHFRTWVQFGAAGGSLIELMAQLRNVRLLPEAFLHGFAFTMYSAQGRATYMLGEVAQTGRWMFFPLAMAIKTPLGLAGVLLLSLGAAVSRGRRKRRDGRRSARAAEQAQQSSAIASASSTEAEETSVAESSGPRTVEVNVDDEPPAPVPDVEDDDEAEPQQAVSLSVRWAEGLTYQLTPLLVLLVVYWAFALTSNLNIGHRHVLVTYPVLFILAGGAGYWFTRRIIWRGAATVAMLGWFAASSATAYPHYLSYFNELVGGPNNGYRYLVDSSLDWGQDLPALSKYLEQHPDEKAYLMFFGTGVPEHYGVEATVLYQYMRNGAYFGGELPRPLEPGLYAISATLLQGVYTVPAGPWTPDHQDRYERSRTIYYEYRNASPQKRQEMIDELGQQRIRKVAESFTVLRTARIAAYLRQQTPDARPAPSLMVYRLSEAELADALYGPINDDLIMRHEALAEE